jgi:hypothetical protein
MWVLVATLATNAASTLPVVELYGKKVSGTGLSPDGTVLPSFATVTLVNDVAN